MIFLQALTPTYTNLQALIAGLYTDMMPLAAKMISVGNGIAGLGAMIYIFYRLWPVLAGSEQLDFLPLMRPFAIAFLLMFYMGFVDLMNAVLSPVVNHTSTMANYQNQAVFNNIKRKTELLKEKDKRAKYVQDEEMESSLSMIAAKIGAAGEFLKSIPEKVETAFRQMLAEILELFFYAAGLIINAIRTFYLIMLVIIGPLAIGFSVFPGFEGTFSSWIARYVQIYMWLPIANILGAILARFQALMVEQDIQRLMANGDYDGADMGYMVFLLFGICSYMTIPSVASWIIESSGAGRALRSTSDRIGHMGRNAGAVLGNFAGKFDKKIA